MLFVPKKSKNHCEENKKVAQREECLLHEKCLFAPSSNVFWMENQDGFEQQNLGVNSPQAWTQVMG